MISWSHHLTNGGMHVLCDNVYIFVSVCDELPEEILGLYRVGEPGDKTSMRT